MSTFGRLILLATREETAPNFEGAHGSLQNYLFNALILNK